MFYGFISANSGEEPAWFHHAQSAINFANACGWEIQCGKNEYESREYSIDDLDTTCDVGDGDILDTPEKVWTK